LTDPDDLVVDPFAGSCVTGEVCERIRRRWICIELYEEYLKGAMARFRRENNSASYLGAQNESDDSNYYRLARPGLLWNDVEDSSLPADGGKRRQVRREERWGEEEGSASATNNHLTGDESTKVVQRRLLERPNKR